MVIPMDWAIVVELVKALAWPVVVVILGLAAKPILKGVVDRVRRVSAGDKSIELDEVPKPPQLEPPKQPDQKQLPPPKENPPPQLEPEQPAPAEPDLLNYDATAAVINAWARLVETMRREAIRLELLAPSDGNVTPGAVLDRLRQRNVVSPETAQQIQALMKIRNELAHGRTLITRPAAEQYVVTVEAMIQAIEGYADIIQLRRIFTQLGVDYTNQEQVRQIRVGRVSATGVSADPQAAAEMARRRRDMWAARFGGRTMQVTERDAALLIARGAQLGDPETRD